MINYEQPLLASIFILEFGYFLNKGGKQMAVSTILLIFLILLVIGAVPAWPYSTGWGYYPSGVLGLLFIVILILVLAGRF